MRTHPGRTVLEVLIRKAATFLLEGVVFSSLESAESFCMETVLLVLPELFTSSETLCTL